MSFQKTKALVYDGAKVVGNAIAYGAIRVFSMTPDEARPAPCYSRYDSPLCAQAIKAWEKELEAITNVKISRYYLKESVNKFKADWKGEPLSETRRQ